MDEDGSDGGGAASDDAVSLAGTEAIEKDAIPDESDEEGLQQGSLEQAGSGAGSSAKAAKKHRAQSFEVSPRLEAELAAFDAHRAAPLNQSRKGVAVAPATRENDRGNIVRFLGWVNATYTLKSPATLGVFAHANVGAAAQRYMKVLIEERGLSYAYGAKIAASLVAVASFVGTRQTMSIAASTASAGTEGPIHQLKALHLQCQQQARQHDKFSLGAKSDTWLDWEAVQRVRVAAEEAAKTETASLKLVRDVLILRLLADQPPDRVGVTRKLRLGFSLKRKVDGAGYELDLSEPGMHKTAAAFGATRTSISSSITPWLSRYIVMHAIPHGGYLFHARGNEFEPISPSGWTYRVKAIFARHGDVALCPKDTRASFITFLRSGEHDNETVKAAAVAMRHSSKTQASAAYDKGASDRRVSAAMKVASDYSARFNAGAGS
jgi:hypothetical protein